MYPDPLQQPYDHTGYGPAGAGYAPTAHEMRQQQVNRYYSDRSALAMQFLDPRTTAASMSMARLATGSQSPAELRRFLYNTAGGQSLLDASMLARRRGMLGHGDPVTYSHNVVQGVAGGGFTASASGYRAGVGNFSTMNQDVSGNGAITDRVALNYQRGLLQDLYGKGTPDPSKLHGFDMAEASGVFSTLARRGGVGHAAHIEFGATAKRRLEAAKQAAIDPSIRAALDGVTLSSDGDAANVDELKKAAKIASNPKVKKTLDDLASSTDAVFVNSDGRRKMARVVENVIEGMAAVSDIYGELNSTQLQQKLEEISGIRITNSNQAKRATQMVSDLRGAAEISGMDPRAFMEYASYNQATLQGRVQQAYGFDARHAGTQRAVTGAINADVMTQAGAVASMSRRAAKAAAARGVTIRALSVDEIAADLNEGQMAYATNFKGIMTLDGLALKGANAKEKDAILARFNNAKTEDERMQIEQEAQQLVAANFSTDETVVDFEAASESPVARAALLRSRSDPKKNEWHTNNARKRRDADVNVAPIMHAMHDGATEADARRLNELGPRGLMHILGADSPETRSKFGVAYIEEQRRKMLEQAGYSAEESDAFLSRHFKADGTAKDLENYKTLTETTGESSWGRIRKYDEAAATQDYWASIAGRGDRQRIRAGDQGISVRSIANSLVSGKITGLSGTESMGLALQAMEDEGLSMKELSYVDDTGVKQSANIKDVYASGIDFTNGIRAEDLEKLDKLSVDGKFDLAGALDMESREALIKATQGGGVDAEKLIKRAHKMMSSGIGGVTIGGGKSDIVAISDRGKDLAKNADVGGVFKRLGAIRSIFGLQEDESNAMLDSVRGSDTGEADLSMFDDMDHVSKLVDTVNRSKGSQLAAVSSLNKDGALVGKMEHKMNALRNLQRHGYETVSMTGSDGQSSDVAIADAMASLRAAIDKLNGVGDPAEKGQQVMHVQHLKVENWDK